MKTVLMKVREFHERNGIVAVDSVRLPSNAEVRLRHTIMQEEWHELEEAMARGDIVAVADACADLVYTIAGTMLTYGIPGEVFDEVHRSNMTKDTLDPVTKKGGKGPQYSPPNIAALLQPAVDRPLGIAQFASGLQLEDEDEAPAA